MRAKRFIAVILVMLLASLVLAGCGENNSDAGLWGEQKSNPKLREVFPNLEKLEDSTGLSLYVEQNIGSSNHRGKTHYLVEQKNNQFTGFVVYSAFRSEEGQAEISIPPATIQTFLQKLADIPVQQLGHTKTPYSVSLPTGFSSTTRILLQTSKGLLKFSIFFHQGGFTPWFVEFENKAFEADKPTVFNVLQVLQPYLKTEIAKSLKETVPVPPASQWPSNGRIAFTKNAMLNPKNIRFLQTEVATFKFTTAVSSPDKKTWATGTSAAGVRLWDSTTGALIANLEGHKTPITALAYSPDGRYLASASSVGNSDQTREDFVNIWDMQPSKTLFESFGKFSWRQVARLELFGTPRALAFSPDGKFLASAGEDRIIRLWEIPSGKSAEILTAKISEILEINSLAFSPDGKFLVAASEPYSRANPTQNTLQVWDMSSKQFLTSLKGHSDKSSIVTFSPDGKTLASTSADGIGGVKVWDVANWKELYTLMVGGKITSLNYSPDGKYLAAACEDGESVLWTSAGRVYSRDTLQGSTHNIYLAFSPDSKQIYSLHSYFNSIKTWKIE